MDKRTRFNLLYLLFALIGATLLQSWWLEAQTVEIIPYSDFETLAAEGRFSEIAVGDRLISGVGALGYTIQRPTEDRFLMTREELENKMAVLLGGRAAEEIVFGRLSTGAADDLVKVANIARSMVTRYGMVESLGQLAYEDPHNLLLGEGLFPRKRDYSEQTAHQIDVAVREIVNRSYDKARTLLAREKPLLERGAQLLLQKETLAEADLAELRRGMGIEKAA